MACLHTHATGISSSGGVACQPFHPIRGFGILSGVSHPKSYTVIVGGSMSSKAFHSMGCIQVCLNMTYWYVARSVRLEAARLFLGHIHVQVETVKTVNTFI